MKLLSISFNYKKTTNLGYIHSMGETYDEAINNAKEAQAVRKGYSPEDVKYMTIRSCTEMSNDETEIAGLVLPKSKH